jgi:membrane-associated PAP2 superfamily phosphatase
LERDQTVLSVDVTAPRQPLFYLLAPLVASGMAFIGWDALGLDNAVSGYWGNSHGFALKNDPLWGTQAYKIERLIGWACMAVLVWMVCKPTARFPIPIFSHMPKHQRVFMLAGVIAALLVIQFLKRRSLTSCPWDYQVFGGIAQDISHWKFGVRDGGPGHCFPAGHPSAGFAFLTVPAFVMLSSPRHAKILLVGVLMLGALLGATQVVRGAHFVSHVLWSAWWCGAVACLAVVLAWLWGRAVKSPDSI